MINTWNESYLHEELKEHYRGEGDEAEAPVGTAICDILHQDGSITEIQTTSLGKLRLKLERLLEDRKVRLVYPIAERLVLETKTVDGSLISSRKSPKKGTIYQVFRELTGIYHLIPNERLTLDIVFANITEFRIADGTGSWRRKGVRIENRKLDSINRILSITSPRDLLSILPENLPSEFTTADLEARGTGKHAGHMVWVLRKLGLIEKIGTRSRRYVYRIS